MFFLTQKSIHPISFPGTRGSANSNGRITQKRIHVFNDGVCNTKLLFIPLRKPLTTLQLRQDKEIIFQNLYIHTFIFHGRKEY